MTSERILKILVNWNDVSGVTEYEVYRKDGLLDYESLGRSVSNSYTDNSYPKDVAVSYAVKSVSGLNPSPLSDPSESLTEWIQGFEASVLSSTNEITVSWLKQTDAEKYLVYRLGTKKDFSTDKKLLKEIENPETIEFVDSGADENPLKQDTPYFYQICWEKGGVEYGASSPIRFGLISNSLDLDEPLNNDYMTVKDGNIPEKPVLYSFSDGNGGSESDDDWYRYECETGQNISVKFKILSNIKNVYIVFYHNDKYSKEEVLNHTKIEAIHEIKPISGEQEKTTLYFKIYPNTDSNKNLIGTYSVTVGNEFK